MSAPRERIPVWLITGWLGSGKTTLLAQWLRDPALADAAVVVNELGEVGLDDRLLASSMDSGAGVALLAGGCVCCTGLPGLDQALADLFWDRLHRRRPRFSSVVVETTGMADPWPVVEALCRESMLVERYRLAGVITTVAATAGQGVLQAHPEARAQVAAADVVIVTKADLEHEVEARAAILSLRPDARVLSSAKADLAWPAVRAVLAAHLPGGGSAHDPEQRSAGSPLGHRHHGHLDVSATFIPLPDALPLHALQGRIAEALRGPVLRLKGVVRLDDGRSVSVQWSAGDGQPVIEALEGTPPRAGLTRIVAAS